MAKQARSDRPVRALRARIVDEYRLARSVFGSSSSLSATAPRVNPSQPRSVGRATVRSATQPGDSSRSGVGSNGLQRRGFVHRFGAPGTPARNRRARQSSDRVAEAIAALRVLARSPESLARCQEVRSVLAVLNEGQRGQVVAYVPELVSNLNGVPFGLRMQATHVLIERERARHRHQLLAARAQLEQATQYERGSSERWWRRVPPTVAAVRTANRANAALRNLESLASPFVTPSGAHHTRRFLAYSPQAPLSSGRVIELFGDCSTASHILIMVSGMNNEVGSFPLTRAKLEQVVRLVMREHPEASFAAIEWMGYNSPGYVGSLLPIPAVRGANDLRSFLSVLEVAPEATITIVGHSYGSVLVSEALRHGLGVDRAVFTGSPGVRAKNVADFGLGPEAVFAAANDRDLVVRLKWHGKNPASEPFGAVRLATDGRKHREYFGHVDGSLTARNIMNIALSRIDQLARVGDLSATSSVQRPLSGPELR